MFLLVDTSINVILEMFFLIFNNTNILFKNQEFTWKSYIAAEVLSIIWQVEIMNKKEFSNVVLVKNI